MKEKQTDYDEWLIRRAAAEVGCDQRSIKKRLAGGKIRGVFASIRVEEAITLLRALDAAKNDVSARKPKAAYKIAKLPKRYPDGFSSERSVNRTKSDGRCPTEDDDEGRCIHPRGHKGGCDTENK
jgi:hypothetical protein